MLHIDDAQRIKILDFLNYFFTFNYLGETHLELDCRPSDGAYLSEFFNKDFYVKKDVWDKYKKTVQDYVS